MEFERAFPYGSLPLLCGFFSWTKLEAFAKGSQMTHRAERQRTVHKFYFTLFVAPGYAYEEFGVETLGFNGSIHARAGKTHSGILCISFPKMVDDILSSRRRSNLDDTLYSINVHEGGQNLPQLGRTIIPLRLFGTFNFGVISKDMNFSGSLFCLMTKNSIKILYPSGLKTLTKKTTTTFENK